MLFLWMILFIDSIASLLVGRCDNCVYVASNDSSMIFNSTNCETCLCHVWSSHSPPFLALNCFNNGTRCQLFRNYSTSYTMLSSQNSTFFFHPRLPPLETTSVQTTSPVATSASSVGKTTTLLSTDHTTASILRRWNSTGITIAGNTTGASGVGANQLYCPYSLLLDTNRSLLIADYRNNRIVKWLGGAASGMTIAGQSNGVAGSSSTAIWQPVGMVLDASGNMYFTDRGNHRVMFWRMGATSGSVIAGTGSTGSAMNEFNTPSALVRISSSRTLYIADTFNHRIMQYLVNATSGTVVAGGNGAGAGSTQLNSPYCFVFDQTTNSFLIVNYGAHTIVRWVMGASSWTIVVGTPGSFGATSTLLHSPLSIVLDAERNMYVADSDNHRIQFFLVGQSNGTTIAGVTGSLGTTVNRLNYPYWAIVDDDLNLYVADTFNNRVQKFERY